MIRYYWKVEISDKICDYKNTYFWSNEIFSTQYSALSRGAAKTVIEKPIYTYKSCICFWKKES